MAREAAAAAMKGKKLHRGPWQEDEDELLNTFVSLLGSQRWDFIARVSGLKRSGKSCRLRWLNYLRPNIKHGHISAEEEQIILQLHKRWGNKWARIAERLPGRTDNDIKNYWRTYLRRKVQVKKKGDQHEFLFEKGGNATPQCSNEGGNHKSFVDVLETENISSDAAGTSDFGLTNSPYETRISDWISEFSGEEGEIKYHHEYWSCLESCCHYSGWISEDSDIWETCSDSLWNMD
ncbi:hypothetical protein SLE2022_101520 [Rubroshorea leprosula]